MRVRSFPPDHAPWPPDVFPGGLETAIERLRTRLLDRVDENGALREPCRSRVLETALLLRLMERADFTSSARARLTAYLEARRNSEEPIARALARAALAGKATIPAELVSQLVSTAPEFTRSRKRLMIDALLTVFGAPPLDELSQQAGAFSTIGLHPWAEVQVTAIKVILAEASAQPHLVRAGDIELLRSTQRAPWVWEGNVLVHLLSLHALLPLPGTADIIRAGIAKALEHQRDDGGMPFVSDVDIWCTATAGMALSAVGVPHSALAPLARYLLAQQHANGGWAYTDRALLTDVDDTAVTLEFLRTMNQQEHTDAIKQADTFLLSMRDHSGGFPTYVPGAPPEACMTAAAVNALSINTSAHEKAMAQGLEFLAQRQNEDGTFGPDWSLSRLHAVCRAMLATQTLGPVPPAAVQRMRTRMADAVLTAQNSDGGWGHVTGRPSDAISTSYALITLCWQPDPTPLARGVSFLLSRQQTDGSIASVPDMVGPRPFVLTFPVLSDIYALLALGHLMHRTAVVPGARDRVGRQAGRDRGMLPAT
jgi:squalene-hopene/tetraprenyl-beta-curcumene cyclase